MLSRPYATARAVARIDKLARWTFPLLAGRGTLVALKGGSAAEELAAEEKALRKLGMTASRVVTYGAELLPVATTTLQLTVGAGSRPLGQGGEAQRRKQSAKRLRPRQPVASDEAAIARAGAASRVVTRGAT